MTPTTPSSSRKRGPMERWLTPLAGAMTCISIPLLFGADNYVMSLIVAALVIGCVAMSWALLGNLGGMVSFGHSAFFGIGAYTSAILTIKLGVPVLAGMALGGLGALLAAIVMLPVLRLRGPTSHWPSSPTPTSSASSPPNGLRSPAARAASPTSPCCRRSSAMT